MSHAWLLLLALGGAACVGRSTYVPQRTNSDSPNANPQKDKDDEEDDEDEDEPSAQGTVIGDANDDTDTNVAPTDDGGAEPLEPAPSENG